MAFSLLCRVRRHLCAIPLDCVVETMRPLPIEPLTDTPAFVRGLALIRGRPVPVVDIGALLNTGDSPKPARFVTLRTGGRQVAVCVEAVAGVRELDGVSQDDLPPLLRTAGADIIAAVGILDAELLLVLQTARLVPDSVWQAIEIRETS
jgi:purine-binding chemotaxis protein CheW